MNKFNMFITAVRLIFDHALKYLGYFTFIYLYFILLYKIQMSKIKATLSLMNVLIMVLSLNFLIKKKISKEINTRHLHFTEAGSSVILVKYTK